MLWSHEAAALGLGATPVGAARAPITGMSIDTRTLQPGDLFFALVGENRDGHAFVEAALAKGAAAAVVTAENAESLKQFGRLLVVDDALKAMERLGRASRARSKARIGAVTGSVGKTSTKEALRHVLSHQARTHASVASYNNHWGVPLTLARMPADSQFGIFEIGMNHSFEILPLVDMVRPEVAIVTTVEPVHLEHFRSVSSIADAKGEIFSGLLPGGTAIINSDNPHAQRLKSHAAASAAGRIVTFGSGEGADARLTDCKLDAAGSDTVVTIGGRRIACRVGMPGRHMALNAVSVLAGVWALGADLDAAATALGSLEAGAGRGQRTMLSVGNGEVTLLDESYNANPASMRAAIQLLAALPVGRDGRRIAVLGDMLELGPTGAELHRELSEVVAAVGIDLVFCSGPLMRNLHEALPSHRRGAYAIDSATLQPLLLEALQAGDAVMIKGSLGSRMGPVVAGLKSRYGVNGSETIRGRSA
jgi:UDP-N-acetylmuramoyl-tripeptide--D-alanyl-D-alanine ligase